MGATEVSFSGGEPLSWEHLEAAVPGFRFAGGVCSCLPFLARPVNQLPHGTCLAFAAVLALATSGWSTNQIQRFTELDL